MTESNTFQIGLHWPGFRGITNLIIFGASYCDIGHLSPKKKPNANNPLDIEFPGICWTEDGQPNWVGHLITKHCPQPRFHPSKSKQSEEYLKRPLLVYNYARGGDTVDGVEKQITHYFLPELGTKPDWAPWSSENTLFMTWVGINDCGAPSVDIRTNVEKLLELQERLYEVGARNFLLFGVPPLHRSPAGRGIYGFRRERADNWNNLLGTEIETFAAAHRDVTASLFSPTSTLNRLLDDPSSYGFGEDGADIWMDHIHPTSRVHDILAADLARFLNDIKEWDSGAGEI